MKINFLHVLLIVCIFGFGCNKISESFSKEEKQSRCKWDDFYKKDIHRRNNSTFHYPPDEFPVVGKTTEAEFYKMITSTRLPNSRASLKKPVELVIKNRKIKIDKYLVYIDYRKRERRYRTKNGKYVFERKHSDYIDYYVLFYKGIVTYYTTSHMIKKNRKWTIGEHHNGYGATFRDEYFPGQDYLQCMYALEQPAALCVFGEEVTQAECDQYFKKIKPWR